MSDITAFEALVASDSEQKIAKQAAADKLAAAIYDVREQYGAHLFCAKTKDEFNDRVALCKDDMIRTVNAHLMPVTGVMRKVCKAMEREWRQKLAYGDDAGLPPMEGEPVAAAPEPSGPRPLHEIARDIKRNWPKVNFAAKPYLDAMHQLESVDDMYYQDPASHIVNYFLANAGTWRGPEAKRIKDELKALVGHGRRAKTALSEEDLAAYAEMFGNSPVGGHQHTQSESGYAEEWHPSHKKADNTGPNMDIDQTYSPSDDELIPEGDFHGYLDSVDQNAPSQVSRDFSPGGDSGKQARRRQAADGVYAPDQSNAFLNPVSPPGFGYPMQSNEDMSGPAGGYQGPVPSPSESQMKGAFRIQADDAPGMGSSSDMMIGPAGQGGAGMHDPSDPAWQPVPNSDPNAAVQMGGNAPQALTAAVIRRYAQWCVDNLARPSLKTMEYYAANRPDREYFILTAALQRHAEVPGGGGASDSFWKPDFTNILQPGHQESGPVYDPNANKPQAVEPWADMPGFGHTGSRQYVAACRQAGIQPTEQGYRQFLRTAGSKDYLQQADEAITNLLNEKAEEFQESIQPLQQALQTIQYAEQVQQAQNPMNVMPPAGTVNVLPQAQGPQGPAPQGVDPSSGQIDPAILQQLMGMGGMDPSAMAGGGQGGPPPAAAQQGALPPEIAQQMQMQARRRLAMPYTEDGYVEGDGWIPGEDFDPHDPDEMEIMEHVFAQEKQDAMRKLQEENERLRRQLDPEGLGDDYENYLADKRQGWHEGAVSELGYDWPPKEDEYEYTPDPRTPEEWMKGRKKTKGSPKKAEAPQRGRTAQGQTRQAGILDEWQNWLQDRAQRGQLGIGGDKDLYDFAAEMGIGNRGIQQLRRYLFGGKNDNGWYRLYEERLKKMRAERGSVAEEDKKKQQQKTAWMGWGPTVAERQHKVDGWQWDKRLSAYVATDIPDSFMCKCGAKLSVPGYHNCKCGKIWNSYVIGTGGENRQAAVEKFLCREVPVRDNVIVANRKLAAQEHEHVGTRRVYDGSGERRGPNRTSYRAKCSCGQDRKGSTREEAEARLDQHIKSPKRTAAVPDDQIDWDQVRRCENGECDHPEPTEPGDDAWAEAHGNPHVPARYKHKQAGYIEDEDGRLYKNHGNGELEEDYQWAVSEEELEDRLRRVREEEALRRRRHQKPTGRTSNCKCWKGYERVPGTKPCAPGSCRKCDGHRKAMRSRRAAGVQVSLTHNGIGSRWNIHRPGCPALNRYKQDREAVGHDELNEYPDRRSVVMDIYPPDQFDYDPDHPQHGWKSYGKDIRVHDCLKGQLPEDARTAARKTAFTGARYVLLPHWDTAEAHRILMHHAHDMGSRTALQVTPELMDHARQGGFTLHDHIGDAPKDGYMVSLAKNSEDSRPIAELTPQDIEAFVTKNASKLGKPGNYLGGWLDNGRFYLDVSRHVPKITPAIEAGIRNNQLGIYDLANGRTISTYGLPGIVGRRTRGTAHPAQERPARGRQRPARSGRSATAGKDNCPACGKGIRSYDLSGTEDHRGQKWCKSCLPDGIKAQMKQSNLLDAVSTKVGSDDDETDYASAAFPSDHHPDTGNKLKSTPDDWHRRDRNQRWTGKA